jgi:hypothetical protein
MKLTILAPDCESSRRLEAVLQAVLEKNHIEAQVEQIRDRDEIERWPMSTIPGLACDGKLLLSGRIPTADELECLLGAAGAPLRRTH